MWQFYFNLSGRIPLVSVRRLACISVCVSVCVSVRVRVHMHRMGAGCEATKHVSCVHINQVDGGFIGQRKPRRGQCETGQLHGSAAV